MEIDQRDQIVSGLRHDLRNLVVHRDGASRSLTDQLRDARRGVEFDRLADALKPGRRAGIRALRELLARQREEHEKELDLALSYANALVAASEEIVDLGEKSVAMLSIGLDNVKTRVRYVSLTDLLTAVHAARKLAASANGIDLRVVPSRVQVLADRSLLSQIIGNIVGNAITHSGATRITLGVRRRGEGCRVEVHDNGRGIDSEALPLVFARGWRGVSSATGTGLGLWIASSLAAILGVKLSVKSTPGRGTVFRIWFEGPLEIELRKPRLKSDLASVLKGKLVAVLDDNRDTLYWTRTLFERYGASVITAQNTIDMLYAVFNGSLPDLFVLDFVLQGDFSDGFLFALRQRYPLANAVIVTAQPDHPRLKAVPNISVFQKPLTEQSLTEIVRTLLPK